MEDSLKILNAREEKMNIISRYINEYNIVILKVNMLGNNKNNNLSLAILGYTFKLVINNKLFSGVPYEYIESLDGNYYLFKFSKNINNLKETCIDIEESDPIGRLIDLDVYESSEKSLNRTIKRKCVVCNNDAFICIRNHTHTFNEVIRSYKHIAFDYFSEVIKDCIINSAITELNLENKFGCVTKSSSGSHKDLDYNLMVKAINVITPYLVDMFRVGFYEDNNYFKEINKIGICAENEMFNECKTNCYKGLIFCLGILVTAIGIYIKSVDNISIKDAIKVITSDYNPDSNINTFGNHVYKELGFGGIRREVLDIYPTVFSVIDKLDLNDFNSIYNVFLDIIKLAEDTVLLKRSGSIDKYNYYKNLISNINRNNKEEIDKVNKMCIDNNISLGGSCDLLVCTLFIKNIFKYFNI